MHLGRAASLIWRPAIGVYCIGHYVVSFQWQVIFIKYTSLQTGKQ